jgi:MFS family permease
MVFTFPFFNLEAVLILGRSVIVQIISQGSFTSPPYNYQQSFVGLFSISGFIGALVSFFLGGKFIDMVSKRRTLFHNGRREPEYRLYAIVFPAIIGPIGMLLFGFMIADRKFWLVPAVGNAMQGFGVTAISNIVVTYVVDSYLPLAAEAMILIFLIKGIIGAVLVLYTIDWVEAAGVKQSFGQMVGVQYFICLFVIVFLVFGKRIRVLTVGYGPMQ